MDGHLFVVGWTSTPSWWKRGTFQTLVVFLFWRRPYRRPPQGGGSGLVPIHGEVQETAVSCHGGSWVPLVALCKSVYVEICDEIGPFEFPYDRVLYRRLPL